MPPRPDELLAAYADGAELSEPERESVERWLAEHPDARAELDAVRALLSDARAAAPRSEREPAWDAMARAIDDAVSASSAPGPIGRLLDWWRARPIAAAGVAVALVAAAALVALRARTAGEPTTASVAPSGPSSTKDDAPEPIDLPALDEAWNADELAYEPEPTQDLDGREVGDLFATAPSILTPSADDSSGASDDDDDGVDDDGDGALVDFGVAPEFDTFLDELSDSELELIDTTLSERKPS